MNEKGTNKKAYLTLLITAVLVLALSVGAILLFCFGIKDIIGERTESSGKKPLGQIIEEWISEWEESSETKEPESEEASGFDEDYNDFEELFGDDYTEYPDEYFSEYEALTADYEKQLNEARSELFNIQSERPQMLNSYDFDDYAEYSDYLNRYHDEMSKWNAEFSRRNAEVQAKILEIQNEYDRALADLQRRYGMTE